MHRVVITGSAGYLGSRLVEALKGRGCAVLGVDMRPRAGQALDRFVQCDICDPTLPETIRDFGADTIIHAAFVVTPLHDTRETRRVNVEGTRNVLRAAATAGPARLMVMSSATAYGAWPDNPRPLDEDHPLRARHEFPYAADKVAVEGLLTAFAAEHPAMAVSCVRPCIVGGPAMDNYLGRAMFDSRFMVQLSGHDQPYQLLHEDDLVAAVVAILAGDGRGAFNVAPADAVRVSELGRRRGRRVMRIPFAFCWLLVWIGWTLRLPRPATPPGYLYFLRYPWVIRSRRLRDELGFHFRHTTAETMEGMIQLRERQAGATVAPRPPVRADTTAVEAETAVVR